MSPLPSEVELRRPLADIEVKEGVAVKVAEAAFQAVYDAVIARMNASGGRLYGQAFPSFKGAGNIHLEYFLDWRGDVAPTDDQREKVIDNHPFSFIVGNPVAVPGETDGDALSIDLEIKETPPNVFRKETGQPIPVAMNNGGKITEKKVKYQPRRK